MRLGGSLLEDARGFHEWRNGFAYDEEVYRSRPPGAGINGWRFGSYYPSSRMLYQLARPLLNFSRIILEVGTYDPRRLAGLRSLQRRR